MFERLQSFLDGLSKRTVIIVAVVAALVVVPGGAGGEVFGYQRQIRETCADVTTNIGQLNEKVTATQARAETVLDEVRDVETNDEYLDQGEDNALTRRVRDLSETTELIDNDLACDSQANIGRLRGMYVETNAQYACLSAAVSELDDDFYQYISKRMKQRAEETATNAAQQAQQRSWDGGYKHSDNAPRHNYSGGGSGGYSGGGNSSSGLEGIVVPLGEEELRGHGTGDGWNCSCIGDTCIGKACP